MEDLDKRIAALLDIGSGDGNGDSSGYGNGFGDGDGYGNVSGYGNGFGNGFGNGDGNGDIQEYDGHRVYDIDDTPTCLAAVRGNIAEGFTLRHNVFPIPCFVARVENCLAHGKTAREALAEAQSKAMRAKPLEERIKDTVARYHDPDKPIPHAELFTLHNTLTGSCLFGRTEFAKSHGLNPKKGKMTMRRFLNLTANAYGHEAIQALAEAYGITL